MVGETKVEIPEHITNQRYSSSNFQIHESVIWGQNLTNFKNIQGALIQSEWRNVRNRKI